MLRIDFSKKSLLENLSKIKTSSFVKNVLVVMTGTGLAQLIGFLLSPIISRLYTPSDFGVLGSFFAITTTIAAGVTLEYAQAIVIPKEKKDAIVLFIISCICTLIITLLCLLSCFVIPDIIYSIITANNPWILVLLVIATFIAGINQSIQSWCVRVKAFKQTSISQIVRSISSNGTQIGFGFSFGGSLSLIIANVLGDILACINMFRIILSDKQYLAASIQWGRIKKAMKEYKDFPIYLASQNVINTLSQGLPVLLLNHYYGIAVAGSYAFGVRILQTPMGFVLRSLRQVLFQKACETDQDGGRLLPLFYKTTIGLFGLAVIPSLILAIWAPQLFSWIFGAKWQTAGEYARSLVLWMSFMFCNLPSVLFARIIRIQRDVFIFELFLIAARAVVLILGGMYMTASNTILCFSVIGALMNIIFIVIVGYAILKKEGTN